MKNRNVSSQPITKTDLKLALKKYATKEDLKNEIKLNAEEILTKVDENAKTYRDQILTELDGVMGELGIMREENIIGSGQTSQLREYAENHEKRIKNLEKSQLLP